MKTQEQRPGSLQIPLFCLKKKFSERFTPKLFIIGPLTQCVALTFVYDLPIMAIGVLGLSNLAEIKSFAFFFCCQQNNDNLHYVFILVSACVLEDKKEKERNPHALVTPRTIMAVSIIIYWALILRLVVPAVEAIKKKIQERKIHKNKICEKDLSIQSIRKGDISEESQDEEDKSGMEESGTSFS